MIQQIGDVAPAVSGGASIGVEQINGIGGFTTDIRPFAHIHQNSGIFHDPVGGVSGIIRFNGQNGGTTGTSIGSPNTPSFEFSFNGGADAQCGLGYDPRTLSQDVILQSFNGSDMHVRASGTLRLIAEEDVLIDGIEGNVTLRAKGAGPLNGNIIIVADEQLNITAINEPLTLSSTNNSVAITSTNSSVTLNAATTGVFFAADDFNVSSNTADVNVTGDANVNIDSTNDDVNITGQTNVFIVSTADDVGITAGGIASTVAARNVNLSSTGSDIRLTAATLTGGAEGTGGQVQLNPFDSSGVLEYRFGPHESWHMKNTHSSTSGPDSDGFNPIVPSGAIIQMILENAGGGSVNDLQDAYDGGNEIDVDVAFGVGGPDRPDNRGVIVRDVVPGSLSPLSTDFITQQNAYGIAVSGYTDTPLNAHSYGLTRIGPQSIAISASGRAGGAIADIPGTLFLGFDETTNRNIAKISSSGALTMEAGTLVRIVGDTGSIVTQGSFEITAEGGGNCNIISDGGEIFFNADTDIRLTTANGDINLRAASSSVNIDSSQRFNVDVIKDITMDAGTKAHFNGFEATHVNASSGIVVIASSGFHTGGQLRLEAFKNRESQVASGALEYRFGPYQSWHMKTVSTTSGPEGDGFNPLVPSGAIIQMIGENASSTLQDAYDGGNTISTLRVDPGTATNNNLDFAISSGKFNITTNEHLPHFNLEARLFPPSGGFNEAGSVTFPNLPSLGLGDITMHTHSVVDRNLTITNPVVINEATKDAKSLGLGALSLDTGSGIINVSVGSGISQFFNTAEDTVTTTDLQVRFSAGGNTFKDKHFFRVGALHPHDAGIVCAVEGCYKVSYAASCSKTVSDGGFLSLQTVEVRCTLNGLTDTINGSRSFSYHFDTVNSDNTANSTFMMDCDAGDHIALVLVLNVADASETIVTATRQLNMVLEYIGPKRGDSTVA